MSPSLFSQSTPNLHVFRSSDVIQGGSLLRHYMATFALGGKVQTMVILLNYVFIIENVGIEHIR